MPQELIDLCNKLDIDVDEYILKNKPLGTISTPDIDYITKLKSKLSVSGVKLGLNLRYDKQSHKYVIFINYTDSALTESKESVELTLIQKTYDNPYLYLDPHYFEQIQLGLLGRLDNTESDAVIRIDKYINFTKDVFTDSKLIQWALASDEANGISSIITNQSSYYLYLMGLTGGNFDMSKTPRLNDFVRNRRNHIHIVIRLLRDAIDSFSQEFSNIAITQDNCDEFYEKISYIEFMLKYMMQAKLSLDMVDLYQKVNLEIFEFNYNYVNTIGISQIIYNMTDLKVFSSILISATSQVQSVLNKTKLMNKMKNKVNPDVVPELINLFSVIVSTTSTDVPYLQYASIVSDSKMTENTTEEFKELLKVMSGHRRKIERLLH
jgi:hypothetical protein